MQVVDNFENITNEKLSQHDNLSDNNRINVIVEMFKNVRLIL